jgi:hypothetical protein
MKNINEALAATEQTREMPILFCPFCDARRLPETEHLGVGYGKAGYLDKRGPEKYRQGFSTEG